MKPSASRLRPALPFLLLLGLLALPLSSLASRPPLWWDEGWTLTVARTWVERGHYGMLQSGQFAPASLSGHFPVVALAAASFRLFGAGVLQGRLPFFLVFLAAWGLLYWLARLLFGPKTALAALFLSVLFPVSDDLNPLILGHQVLGEFPLLFFTLAGLLLLWYGLARQRLFHLGAMLCWGLALATKAQLLPFWLFSLGIGALLLLGLKQLRLAFYLGLNLAGGWGCYLWFLGRIGAVMARFNHGQSGAPVDGLLSITAFAPGLPIRLANLQNSLLFAWWVAAGLVFFLLAFSRRARRGEPLSAADAVGLVLFLLVGAWLGWFALFAMLWVRYLVPAVFLGSILAAAFFERITDGFDFGRTLASMKAAFRGAGGPAAWRTRLAAAGLGLAAAFSALSLALTAVVLALTYRQPGSGLQQAADYVNQNTPPAARVESYDSELFFLLERDYHYPPDVVSVRLVQRAFVDPGLDLGYDPLAAGPDYVVVGPFAGRYGLYDQVLDGGAFTLEAEFPGYRVYRRVGEDG